MNILISVIFFIGFIFFKKLLNQYIQTQAARKAVPDSRRKFISLSLTSLLFIITVSILLNIIDIGYGDISLFLSSIFAVLGVALIAQWSMLSNVTASVLIFFVFPYRIGDKIKIEGDNMVGIITDIGMFHLSIKRDDGNTLLYPNNLLLQKAVIKLTEPEKNKQSSTAIKINRPPLTRIDK